MLQICKPIQAVEHWRAELMQAGKGELHFRLDADRRGDLPTLRRLDLATSAEPSCRSRPLREVEEIEHDPLGTPGLLQRSRRQMLGRAAIPHGRLTTGRRARPWTRNRRETRNARGGTRSRHTDVMPGRERRAGEARLDC